MVRLDSQYMTSCECLIETYVPIIVLSEIDGFENE